MDGNALEAATAELNPTTLDVTTTDLFTSQLAGPTPRAVGEAPRRLRVAGVVVAELCQDPSRLNPMCATSAEGMPVVEVLAAIAAQDPTGVLVIETADLRQGFSFEVVRGKVTGARGPGKLGQLELWCAEVHRCYPDRFGTGGPNDPLWIEVARTFVRERVLDHLELALSPGARLTFIRGDAAWKGTRLPEGKAIALHHLLLEHARRWDEMPRVLKRLGACSKIAVPLSEPPAELSSPPPVVSAGEESWDFFADPDPAALEEWGDSLLVWPLCDGQHSIDEIVDLSMLGRFRGLAALATLVDRHHVVLVEGSPAGNFAAIDLGETPDEMTPTAEVLPIRPPDPAPAPVEQPRMDTEYSVVLRKPRAHGSTPAAPASDASPRRPIKPPVVGPPPATRRRVSPAPPLPSASDSFMTVATATPPPPASSTHAAPDPAASSAGYAAASSAQLHASASSSMNAGVSSTTHAAASSASHAQPAGADAFAADVIDEMIADLDADDRAPAATVAAPFVSVTPDDGAAIQRRLSAITILALVIGGALLFVTGAAVALHMSRATVADTQE